MKLNAEKKLDPNFGKCSITIEKSNSSNNWLINVNDHCFDSSIKYEDAQKVAEWLKNEIEKNPLPRKCSQEQFNNWVTKYADSSPDVKAEMKKYDRETKELTTFVGSASNISDSQSPEEKLSTPEEKPREKEIKDFFQDIEKMQNEINLLPLGSKEQEWLKLRMELKGINFWKQYKTSNYALARKMLYEAILPLEHSEDCDSDKVKKAGKLLYETEGNKGMQDRLLWSFIPKSCQRLIDIYWDGIGDWKA